jgi:hypothetical protein
MTIGPRLVKARGQRRTFGRGSYAGLLGRMARGKAACDRRSKKSHAGPPFVLEIWRPCVEEGAYARHIQELFKPFSPCSRDVIAVTNSSYLEEASLARPWLLADIVDFIALPGQHPRWRRATPVDPGQHLVDPSQRDLALAAACCTRTMTIGGLTGPILGAEPRNALQTGIILMAIHKQILEWQADHPTITWIGWGIVWAIVLSLLFWPSKGLSWRVRPRFAWNIPIPLPSIIRKK